MNKHRRQEIKQAVISTLRSYGEPISLPVPIKSITKSFKNVKLIPYSTHMKRHGLSYDEMLEFAETDDACTDYNAKTNVYLIYYNDLDQNKLTSNRYRWNIAHELGHIVLGHHQKHKESRIFRNGISAALYRDLENEADMFAAYILVPHIILSCLQVQTAYDIASMCSISVAASKIRIKEFGIWRRRNRCEHYDIILLNHFAQYTERNVTSKRSQTWLNRLRRCRHCGSLVALSHRYCKICGNPTNTEYKLEGTLMKYPGIEIDEKGRAFTCPRCQNTELSDDGTYCMICGTPITNHCVDAISPDGIECDHTESLPGNARYCPYCGGETSFLQDGFLRAWNPPKNAATICDKLPF